MIIRPVYDLLLLPEVSYYFKKDFFQGYESEPLETGTDILFLLLKQEKEEPLSIEDFHPIGVSARIEGSSDGETLQIRTCDRVDISDIEISDGQISASAAIRPEIKDLTEEEEKELFRQIRNALLKFVQTYQLGLWVRNFILQRKNINETVCALSDYLNLMAEDKYAILAEDSK